MEIEEEVIIYRGKEITLIDVGQEYEKIISHLIGRRGGVTLYLDDLPWINVQNSMDYSEARERIKAVTSHPRRHKIRFMKNVRRK